MDEKLPIENVNSTPTIVLTDLQKVRFSELAGQLQVAVQQGYIEASVIQAALDAVKALAPFLFGLVAP